MASKTKKAKSKAPAGVPQDVAAKYPHIRKVVATGKKGNPTRVIIGCTMGADGCEKERECAMQDAFQVKRCHSCQREFLKVRRRKVAA